MKKRIGIIGDDYKDDSLPYKILLSKKFDAKEAEFIPLLNGIKGNNYKKICRALPIEVRKYSLDYVICSSDLDTTKEDTLAIKNKEEQWFNPINTSIDKKGLFFLVISELEALILADINTFNRLYNVSINFGRKDPMMQSSPKELLKNKTALPKKYHETHAVSIFSELNFDTVYQNHLGFQNFIEQLEAILKKSKKK